MEVSVKTTFGIPERLHKFRITCEPSQQLSSLCLLKLWLCIEGRSRPGNQWETTKFLLDWCFGLQSLWSSLPCETVEVRFEALFTYLGFAFHTEAPCTEDAHLLLLDWNLASSVITYFNAYPIDDSDALCYTSLPHFLISK
jgi:hypothetical protein